MKNKFSTLTILFFGLVIGSCQLKKWLPKTGSVSIVAKINSSDNEIANKTVQVLKKRLDNLQGVEVKFDYDEKQKTATINLHGIDDKAWVNKILEKGNVEFWATYFNEEIATSLMNANKVLSKKNHPFEKRRTDSTDLLTYAENAPPETFDLFKIWQPVTDNKGVFMQGTAVVGYINGNDTSQLNRYLNLLEIKNQFPANCTFYFGAKPVDFTKRGVKNITKNLENIFEIYAIKKYPEQLKAPLDGAFIVDAKSDVAKWGGNEVLFQFNNEGSLRWQNFTRQNIKRAIAIMVDNKIYSAPTVQNEITGGRCSITGDFTPHETLQMAAVLNFGVLPASVTILAQSVVK